MMQAESPLVSERLCSPIFSAVPERAIRWRSLSVENRGTSALWGLTHDAIVQIEYDSILPFQHLGNKDRKLEPIDMRSIESTIYSS